MSSLRSQSPLEYPQMHSPSFPPLPSPGYRISKKEIEVWFFSAQATWSQKRCLMAATPGFKSQSQSSSVAPFLTPPTIGHSCQHSCIFFQLYWAAIVSPGRCGPVVWSQSSPSSHVVSVTGGIASQLYRGLKLIASPWLRARPQLFNTCQALSLPTLAQNEDELGQTHPRQTWVLESSLWSQQRSTACRHRAPVRGWEGPVLPH